METKKPWAIDLAYFTPAASAVYLHDVDVDPRLQRSGVGRLLVERAKAEAKEWPVRAMRLDAYDGPSGGGPFYAKCGFTEVGRTVYRTVPLVYFEYLLDVRQTERETDEKQPPLSFARSGIRHRHRDVPYGRSR
jgi:predicted N-acetyltransferase YhbS